jgi:two-component system sensor histidine kinase/response regulator
MISYQPNNSFNPMSTYNNPGFKILLVDDDPDLLQITERFLKNELYILSTATSGQECIQAICLDKPDLLLLDVMLPDISGVDICKKIRNDPELSTIYVILLSGMKTDSEDISLGLETGADGYLIKPLKKRELLARVEAAIRIIQAEKALRENEEKLRELNAEKDKFFSIIAHDLRSPFNGFLGLTQMIIEEMPSFSSDELLEMAVKMRKSALNLYNLLENLLQWSSMQRGLKTFATLDQIFEVADSKGISIRLNIPEDLMVSADSRMLESVIRNLVTNAVKFTNKGGNITIEAKAITNDMVEIAVKDTGIGMRKSLMDDLFRLDVNTSRKGTEGESSSGLGLVICKDFVEKHGGKLWVESEEGVGSNFYFAIPNNRVSNEKIGVEDGIQITDRKHEKIRLNVLIVDDDDISRHYLASIVRKDCKSVSLATNGKEAVELCKENPDLDLILMDMKMPDMNGYEATNQIRQFNKKVVIIAQTAFGLEGDREKSIEAGCNDHISKPIKTNDLQSLIMKHFNKKI